MAETNPRECEGEQVSMKESRDKDRTQDEDEDERKVKSGLGHTTYRTAKQPTERQDNGAMKRREEATAFSIAKGEG
ncbi:hypothetical protein CVT26_000602 [Gymnopilus dilepis]|uniref:Uncharacterized protein n=1 Tax=Gymnopilus dilepis TaxID=231916 RepID=A0A409Y2E7_9AGAR|nr:hypothetical protein CVT26_000602 [Gymnopilus dilepis]